MTAKYNNIKTYLTENNYTLLTTFENYTDTKKIEYECKYEHKTTITVTSFANKKIKVDSPADLCTQCKINQDDNQNQLTLTKKILELTGHTITEFMEDRQVKYECGNCSTESISSVSNLKRNKTGKCINCVQDVNKNTMDDIKQRVESYGYTLQPNVPYTNNKLVPILCNVGHSIFMSLSDLKRGRRCVRCL